jgi:hypothetical protein
MTVASVTLQLAPTGANRRPRRHPLPQRLAAFSAGKLALPLAMKPRFISIDG